MASWFKKSSCQKMGILHVFLSQKKMHKTSGKAAENNLAGLIGSERIGERFILQSARPAGHKNS